MTNLQSCFPPTTWMSLALVMQLLVLMMQLFCTGVNDAVVDKTSLEKFPTDDSTHHQTHVPETSTSAANDAEK